MRQNGKIPKISYSGIKLFFSLNICKLLITRVVFPYLCDLTLDCTQDIFNFCKCPIQNAVKCNYESL